jgi:hypothetical protein
MGVQQMKKPGFRSLFSILSSCIMALTIFTTLPALAAESAGVILVFTGKVDVVRDAKTLPAARQAELYSGDTISVGDGQAQLRFADGTMLTLYRNTRFAVNDYHYGKGNGDRAQFSLLNGLMHTLTGQIDKKIIFSRHDWPISACAAPSTPCALTTRCTSMWIQAASRSSTLAACCW